MYLEGVYSIRLVSRRLILRGFANLDQAWSYEVGEGVDELGDGKVVICGESCEKPFAGCPPVGEIGPPGGRGFR